MKPGSAAKGAARLPEGGGRLNAAGGGIPGGFAALNETLDVSSAPYVPRVALSDAAF
jgi:hypothetical protein